MLIGACNPMLCPNFQIWGCRYSHDAQRALARIALLQGDTAAHSKWTARMAETAAILKRRLWRESHGACFDRERDGNGSYVTTLVHNNLRAMWHGIFDQHMADTFVARCVQAQPGLPSSWARQWDFFLFLLLPVRTSAVAMPPLGSCSTQFPEV